MYDMERRGPLPEARRGGKAVDISRLPGEET